MSIADATENAILLLIFNATAWSNYADNAAASPQTNIGVALHTADPGDAGSASTSEIAYTSYTRINVARTSGGWTVTAGSVSPLSAINFPTGTGGAGTASFFSTSKSNATPPTGAQAILWSGTVTPNIVCGSGITPQLTTASTITLDLHWISILLVALLLLQVIGGEMSWGNNALILSLMIKLSIIIGTATLFTKQLRRLGSGTRPSIVS
jgi:hypothetical protein